MIRLVYVSAAVRLFNDTELDALLAKARTNNAALGVTGLLLHQDGNFMQALEGPAEVVDRLVGRIEADPRHHLFQRLIREPVDGRLFGDWSMAFARLRGDAQPGLEGFSTYLSEPLASGPLSRQPGIVPKLLESFRATMLR